MSERDVVCGVEQRPRRRERWIHGRTSIANWAMIIVVCLAVRTIYPALDTVTLWVQYGAMVWAVVAWLWDR